jgi:hypothetical protein
LEFLFFSVHRDTPPVEFCLIHWSQLGGIAGFGRQTGSCTTPVSNDASFGFFEKNDFAQKSHILKKAFSTNRLALCGKLQCTVF